MPLALLLVVFVVVPIAELYVIVEVVGEAIGAELTILLLVLDSVLGTLLLRAQGRAAWRRFLDAMRGGQIPHREILDGVLIVVGGALLITPGFLTDAVGLALLLPPTRALARRGLARTLRRRAVVGFAEAATADGPRPRPAGRPYDVEGTATEAPDDVAETGAPPPWR